MPDRAGPVAREGLHWDGFTVVNATTAGGTAPAPACRRRCRCVMQVVRQNARQQTSTSAGRAERGLPEATRSPGGRAATAPCSRPTRACETVSSVRFTTALCGGGRWRIWRSIHLPIQVASGQTQWSQVPPGGIVSGEKMISRFVTVDGFAVRRGTRRSGLRVAGLFHHPGVQSTRAPMARTCGTSKRWPRPTCSGERSSVPTRRMGYIKLTVVTRDASSDSEIGGDGVHDSIAVRPPWGATRKRRLEAIRGSTDPTLHLRGELMRMIVPCRPHERCLGHDRCRVRIFRIAPRRGSGLAERGCRRSWWMFCDASGRFRWVGGHLTGLSLPTAKERRRWAVLAGHGMGRRALPVLGLWPDVASPSVA